MSDLGDIATIYQNWRDNRALNTYLARPEAQQQLNQMGITNVTNAREFRQVVPAMLSLAQTRQLNTSTDINKSTAGDLQTAAGVTGPLSPEGAAQFVNIKEMPSRIDQQKGLGGYYSGEGDKLKLANADYQKTSDLLGPQDSQGLETLRSTAMRDRGGLPGYADLARVLGQPQYPGGISAKDIVAGFGKDPLLGQQFKDLSGSFVDKNKEMMDVIDQVIANHKKATAGAGGPSAIGDAIKTVGEEGLVGATKKVFSPENRRGMAYGATLPVNVFVPGSEANQNFQSFFQKMLYGSKGPNGQSSPSLLDRLQAQPTPAPIKPPDLLGQQQDKALADLKDLLAKQGMQLSPEQTLKMGEYLKTFGNK